MIDSIRNMLFDLDSSIQYPPVNELIKKTVSYADGGEISDSLRLLLRELISEDNFLYAGLRQTVSPHLITKYISFLQRLAEYFSETGREGEYSANMIWFANITRRAGDKLRARKILIQSKAHIPHYEFCYYLAQTYTEPFKADSSYALYITSIQSNALKNYDDSILQARCLFSFADYCFTHNKPDSAFKLFTQQLNLREHIHGALSSEYAYRMIVTADMFTYLGRYAQAQDLNFVALEITRNSLSENSNQYALCMSDIGEVYYRMGEYDKALPYARQSLEIKKRLFGNGYFDNVVNLHNLATLYTRLGLYNEAIPLLKESLMISDRYFGQRMVYAVDLQPLAEVYEYLGEYDKALPIYQKAIGIHQQLQKEAGGDGKNVFYPRVLHSIASLYTKLGQFNKAITYYRQALSLKKEMFSVRNPEYAKTLNAYAEAYTLKGDFKNALALQLKALELAKQNSGVGNPDVASGLYNLAVLYFKQHNLVKSEEYCQAALKMNLNIYGNTHPDVAECFDLLGNINSEMQRRTIAVKYFLRSFDIRQGIMAITHPSYIKSLYNIATCYVAQGKVDKGEQLLMEADSLALLHIEQSYISLSEEEKLTFLHNTERQFQYLPSLLYLNKTSNPEVINRVYHNAMALKSMVLFRQQQIYNSIRNGNDSFALTVYNQWRFNKAVIGQQLLLPEGQRNTTLDSLQDATEQLEEGLSRMSKSFEYKTLSTDVTSLLPPNSAAVEFIYFRLFNKVWTDSIMYAALVALPGQRNVVFVPLFEERAIKKLFKYSNNRGEAAVSYLYPDATSPTPVSRRLYQLVWKKLQPFLAGITTVFYSPTGWLNRVSFAAIQIGNGRLLADQFNLRQLVSMRAISMNLQGTSAFDTAILWGNIDYHSASKRSTQWRSLPGTRAETQNISTLLQERNIHTILRTGKAATKTLFKTMDGGSPALIHVASHGFFVAPGKDRQNSMLRNGILFAGSRILTAYEIANLDLSNTKLVTLSACETAMGDIYENEGVFGLQRAFKMAGVRQVMMSLWPVPDKETSELMTGFYRSLLKGNEASKALRDTQLAMKQKYPPYYWAAFVLTE